MWKQILCGRRWLDRSKSTGGRVSGEFRGRVSGTRTSVPIEVNSVDIQWSGDWQAFLDQQLTKQELAWIRQNLATGRPTASKEFTELLEKETGKAVTPQQRGRKPAAQTGNQLILRTICLDE